MGLSEYYVYESSIEAISNRELFKKKGINLPQYTVSKELTNFDEGSEGEIGFIQLGYALNNRTFSDLMVVLETINKNQRFDYINQLNVSKVNGSDERLNLSFTYTNLGLVTGEKQSESHNKHRTQMKKKGVTPQRKIN